ncbi:MAG: serine/threonine protein phosphatase [Firmicutes bacterium HGW-Firmicutes-20]|jgi:hypothetical protein|nr:MAG: serine/threonine protein phosphatase [Firmicutes bacterium HGW-Firmicutes-20]PKM68973.1 MAG: serine/threonine protein phosphatase [Firmicutes bacterium HGW-Firmicutes-19]
MRVAVDAYYQSLNKYSEELCGDRVAIVHTPQSFVCVLADGLGSGVKANILATLTSTILAEMLKNGIELHEAVYTLTSTLPTCKERQVAYSTFSTLQVFNNGDAVLIEFDNPKAIILRNGREVEVVKHTIHIQNRLVVESRFKCYPNDLIVLVSDGVLHAGLGTILNFGWKRKDVVGHLRMTMRKEDKARDIGENLMIVVNDLYQNQPMDDSTVLVARIVDRTRTVVMVGPPKSVNDDQGAVMKLLSADGKKIVCGGTTAQIVARFLKEDIRLEENISLNSDLPPTANIKGIDLVTEGVLTLGRVVDLLVDCVSSKQQLDHLCSIEAKDGAIKMVQMLLSECSEIVFLAGLADNPAHSQVAYSPLSLRFKVRLIERIAEHLRALGKVVSVVQC